MKISIIIPVYNVELYVSSCLKSVMSQTYQGEIECIIVDDCGTDKSMEIVEEMINNYHGLIQFKILHHEHNRGLSAARNTGIDAATGDYILFVDSDDELKPDCLRTFTEISLKGEYDIIIGGFEKIGIDKKVPELLLPDNTILCDEEILQSYNHGSWYMMAQNKLYSRNFLVIHSLRFKEGIIHEDNLWSFENACFASKMYCTQEKTYIYKIREGSIMTAMNLSKSINSLQTILYEMITFAKQNNIANSEIVHRHIQGVLSLLLYRCHVNIGIRKAKSIYYQIRENNLFTWASCRQVNKNNLKGNVRDIHYFFPPLMGFVIEVLFIHLQKMLSK